jgi:TatD DNase family protein
LPLSEIVLETDSYPQYFKSKRERWTEPKDVAIVAARLAELRGVDVEEIEAQTTANALAMFGGRAGAVRRAIGQ